MSDHHTARSIEAIVEEQVRRWQLARREAERTARPEARPEPNVVAIANALGSGGRVLAHGVGARLGVPVYDRDLVAHIAQTAHVRERTVQALDERGLRRVEDFVLALLREHDFDQRDYVRALLQTVGALWQHGPCVIVGHAGVHIVPRAHVLAVRVVAPVADRVRRVMALRGLTELEARDLVRRTDAQRESFHRRDFHAAIESASNYDLVLNTSRLPFEVAGELVVQAYRLKFP